MFRNAGMEPSQEPREAVPGCNTTAKYMSIYIKYELIY